ncbi:MAG: response regulator [Nitrospina sp.]|jgi:DNA-binding response OmpR family regulator|nr:response regulator [Nitrospina sp.]
MDTSALGPNNRVLIVDDEKKTCMLLSRFLSGRGYQIETASEGGMALHKAREFNPNCVLLDIRLPQGGKKLFSGIKSQLPEVLIIMVAAIVEVTELQEYLNEGAYAYLGKPVNLNQLQDKIFEGLMSKFDKSKVG